MKAVAKETIWRYLPLCRDKYMGKKTHSRTCNRVTCGRLQTVNLGQRCDWAIGGVYEQLGKIEILANP